MYDEKGWWFSTATRKLIPLLESVSKYIYNFTHFAYIVSYGMVLYWFVP